MLPVQSPGGGVGWGGGCGAGQPSDVFIFSYKNQVDQKGLKKDANMLSNKLKD